jgi:hypothetical protein
MSAKLRAWEVAYGLLALIAAGCLALGIGSDAERLVEPGTESRVSTDRRTVNADMSAVAYTSANEFSTQLDRLRDLAHIVKSPIMRHPEVYEFASHLDQLRVLGETLEETE